MDKQVIKGFSQRARNKLIEDVKQRAYILGVLEGEILKIESFQGGFRIKGRENGIFTEEEKKQREILIDEIDKKDYEQVMEEIAYTWFNRFIALRFMEINNYLPSGIRVLSSEEEGKTEPDILSQMSFLDLDIDWDKIEEIESNNKKGLVPKREEIYKHLLIKQCNELGQIMPTVFEEIADYTELLLPDKLLNESSVIRDLVESIEEDDWKTDVEIIGWLYQYYISEKKDEVFADLKKNIKISKENIPAATQLFTPKWIVKYMVENSLGRLWLESHPNEKLQSKWEYYLEEAEQEEEVKEELKKLKNPDLIPEDIKLLDPAMGSGHILVYAFDLLYDIYLSEGYSERQIPSLILENNLYGLDIDDRAGQLAVFALMMKARSKNRRIFRRKVNLNLVSIQESNDISKETVNYFEGEDKELRNDIEYLVETFEDAKEYGSILEVKPIDFDRLEERIEEIKKETPKMYDQGHRNIILEKLPPLVKQGRIMSKKYDVVCTNPPYVGNRGMNRELKKYLDDNYKDSKSDLCTVFIEKCIYYTNKNMFTSMITMHSWMFLSSFEKLRKKVIENRTIYNMAHLGTRAFEEIGGEVVQTTTFTIRNMKLNDYSSNFIRLVDYDDHIDKEHKYMEALENINLDYMYSTKVDDLREIPRSPIAYWISDRIAKLFKGEFKIKDLGSLKSGSSANGQNDKLFRFWHEVNHNKIQFRAKHYSEVKNKWIPLNKGGAYCRWYGNLEYVSDNIFCPQNDNEFDLAITWSDINSRYFSARIHLKGMIANNVGKRLYIDTRYFNYILGFFNTIISEEMLDLIIPTLHFDVGYVGSLPIITTEDENIRRTVDNLVQQNISISKTDWDSFETSWDFQIHPLLTYKGDAATIEEAFDNWSNFAERQFYQLKENEEELNRIFIEIYGLEDELTPDVEEKDVTVSKADRERDIKSFISYAVGCMFGRYSLEEDGLIFAGGEGEDIMIPIADDDYFEEDILERFVGFVKLTFGEENLEKNIDYIAGTLGVRARETSRQAIRRYFLRGFYKDHVKMYKKRPIYWLFNSGRQDGFKALIYMHRYNPDTIAKVRIDYLHNLQKKYEGEIRQLDMIIESDTPTREKNKARKKKEKLTKQILECTEYDQAMNHMASQRIDIDLDDGVKVNYEKFQGVEVPRGKDKKPLNINLLARI